MIAFLIIIFLVFYIPYRVISGIGKSFGDSPKKNTTINHYHTHITNNIENKTISIIDPDTKEKVEKTITSSSTQ